MSLDSETLHRRLTYICDSGITAAVYRVEKEVPGKLIVSTIGSILEYGI